jgi:hypothetical protein
MHRSHTSTRKRSSHKLGKMRKHAGGLFRGAYSMDTYWKPIWAQLQTLRDSGEFRCAMCKSKLPKECTYKTVMSWFGASSLRAKTDVNKLIIRKYNLPSAKRNNIFDNGSIQPTIFYFHCPYCGFLHQFKSSVHMTQLPRKSHRHSDTSYNSSRRRSSRKRHPHDSGSSYARREPPRDPHRESRPPRESQPHRNRYVRNTNE